MKKRVMLTSRKMMHPAMIMSMKGYEETARKIQSQTLPFFGNATSQRTVFIAVQVGDTIMADVHI